MNASVSALQKMSVSELENFIGSMPELTIDQKRKAWDRMDTGIYDTAGNLIGDKEEAGKIMKEVKKLRLDMSKLIFSDHHPTTQEALADVIPFEWSEDVLSGKKKVEFVEKKTDV